jgi:acetoin utilization deacetylase AcuC-like enzyme
LHIYTHDLCLQHEVPAGHPEKPDRLRAVIDHLQASGVSQDYPLRLATPTSRIDLLRAHPAQHIDFIESMTPDEGEAVVPVDPDTWVGAHSFEAARVAAGAVCDGIDDLVSGATNRVFCAVRPPGHHAEADAAMGFCLLNSIAIGALKALAHEDIERVAILDFDVHHGNGTVDIFKDNPDVLVCSSFQHPYYPNRMFDVQRDNIVNTPLEAGTDGDSFRRRIEADWIPAVEQHKPDLILLSAGFDAHRLDPLADLALTEDDFAWVTNLAVQMATQFSSGRVLSTLEGGYDLGALVLCVEAHLSELVKNQGLSDA